jgi:DNA-binding response OmpR family regulator
MARIVIADDDELIVEVIRGALESGGHVVGALPDGEHVGEVIDFKRPQLVILDCAMPGKSGIDALRDIRSSPVAYDTPVLMLTALIDSKDEAIAMRAGANEYLRKPFDSDELLGIVDVMLAKSEKWHCQSKIGSSAGSC